MATSGAGDRVYQPCSVEQCRVLADMLGDTPETVIAVHLLRRGLCRAYLAGDPARFAGLVVQPIDVPAEPMGFGTDAATLWDLLQSVQGWSCIEVAESCSAALGSLIHTQMGRPVRYYADIYYSLTKPVPLVPDAAVRLLSPCDLALLEAAPPELRVHGFGDAHTLLAGGAAAAAIVDGRMVAIAYTSARSPRHADVAVTTLAPWRGRGYAAAAAALVVERVQQEGQTPVWSCGEDNHASHRVAQKLGFVRVGRRCYVIPQ